MALSFSIQLVWPLASLNTVAMGYEFIEPEHLFMALLKFSELKPGEMEPLLINKENLPALLDEQKALRKMFQECGFNIPEDTTKWRRDLRAKMGPGEFKDNRRKIVHRSDLSRSLCEHAVEVAATAGVSAWQGVHLAIALMENPQGSLAEILRDVNLSLPKLVETPLLDKYGSILIPSAACFDRRKPSDAAARVVLEFIEHKTAAALLLIENGGRRADEVVTEVAALLEMSGRRRRFVRIDLRALESSGPGIARLLTALFAESARTKAVLLLENPAELFDDDRNKAARDALVKAIEAEQTCCIFTAVETAISCWYKEQPWRRLLQVVWLKKRPELPF